MASIWHLTVIVFPKKTIFQGVILNQGNNTFKNTSSSFRTALAIAGSYLEKPYRGARLTLGWSDLSLVTETDERGGFLMETNHTYDTRHEIEVRADGRRLTYSETDLKVHFIRGSGDLVISDIDDTVLVSHTNTRLKRVLTTLFRSYERRKPVEETSGIIDHLGGSLNDHAYVSRSEYNLFPMLSNFINHHELPRGPLFLTPFLSLSGLLQNKKDPEFKVKKINYLLAHSENEKVVLIGDDTQHDLQVYAEIARAHGSRIKKIFIRQTDPRIDKRHSSAWRKLDHYVQNMVYYNKETDLTTLNL